MTRFQIAKRQRHDEVVRLRKQGMLQTEIAERMGLSREWINKILRQAGLKGRVK